MPAFYVWNPVLSSPAVLETVITPGEATEIADGTDAFVAAVVADLGIAEPVEEWALGFCRASYFTDYPDADDWHDRWLPAWRLRARLAAAPSEPPRPGPDGSVATEAGDGSWTPEKDADARGEAACLVVADFPSADALREARAAIEAWAAQPLETFTGEALGRYPQLQVILGTFPSDFFEAGAPLAAEVRAICEEHGASVHYRDTVMRDD